MKPFYILSKC